MVCNSVYKLSWCKFITSARNNTLPTLIITYVNIWFWNFLFQIWRAGTTPILEKCSENAGANENLSSPINSGNGSGSCSKNVLLKSWDAMPRMEFRILRAAPRMPRNFPRAPRMAFSLRERFSWNWGGPQASDQKTYVKKMLDVSLRIKYFHCVGQSWWLLTFTWRQKLCQHMFWEFHCNCVTSKITSHLVFEYAM